MYIQYILELSRGWDIRLVNCEVVKVCPSTVIFFFAKVFVTVFIFNVSLYCSQGAS